MANIKPDYISADGRIKLYNIDCMEYMAQCKEDEFDLAVVDPPYGIGESGASNKTRSVLAKSKDYKPFHGRDILAPDEYFFKQLRGKSSNQIIWGANHFIDNFNLSVSSPCWIVWDKQNGNNDFADCELAWGSFKSAVRKFTYKWHGMLQGDMKNKEHRIHPTQKPVKLYDWIYKNYAEKGQRILDTHLGSGSNAIAAHYAGMEFVGCELDADYFAASVERFERETAQVDMFAGAG